MRLLFLVMSLVLAATAAAKPSVRVTVLDDKIVKGFVDEVSKRAYYQVNAFEQDVAIQLRSTRDVGAIAERLAPKYHLSVELMSDLVSLWIRWVQHEALDDFDDEEFSYRERDALRREYEREARIAFMALVKKSGHAKVVVERTVAVFWRGDCKEAELRELMAGAPDAKATAIVVSQTTICSTWRVRALGVDPTNPVLIWSAVEESTSSLKTAQRIAMLEWLGTTPAVRQLTGAAALSFKTAHGRRYINELWNAGLIDEGVRAFEALSDDVRAQLTDEKQPAAEVLLGGDEASLSWDIEQVSRPINSRSEYFALDLAAAYLVLGRADDAAALMRRLPFGDRARRASACRQGRLDGHQDCKLYGDLIDHWFIVDRSIAEPNADPFEIVELQFTGFGTLDRDGLWIALIRKRLDEPAYADMRKDMTDGWHIDDIGYGSEDLSATARSWLSSALNERADHFQHKIADVRKSMGLPVDNRRERVDSDGRRTDPPAATAFRFKERALGKCGKGVGLGASPKRIAALEEGFSPVRIERSGDVVAAISVSQSLDPAGEVSGGGYWVHISRDAGKTWEAPRYTGLAQYFPYVVAPSSCKRMWAGDHLDVAVEINELDRRTITYPPVGLGTKRRKGGLMLTIPLSELDRDSDGDLISDIEEDHLLLKRDNPDSDGDGLRDGLDPLPNVANRKDVRPGDDALAAVLSEIFGRGSFGAIIEGVRPPGDDSLESYFSLPKSSSAIARSGPFLIRGKAEDYASIRPDRMTLVYSDKQIRELERMTPVFAAIWIGPMVMNRDRTRGLVRWSAGWVGGAFRIVRKGKGWALVPISSWIT